MLEGNGQLNIVIAKMEGSILVDIVLLVHYFAVQHNAMNGESCAILILRCDAL